jgi:methyl-accepting chemotaxis protein
MADKKVELDGIGAIRPARDEVSSYRRSNRADAPAKSNFNGILVFVIVVLALMMGLGGFVLIEVQKKLEQSNILLQKGQESVQQLEDRLSATGTDVSKTLQNMQAKMDTNVSEIDKLWAVSYRQNKPAIKENLDEIVRIRSDLATNVAPLSNTVKGMIESFNKLSSNMTEVRQGLLIENEETTTQMSMVRGQVQDQSVQVEGNKREISILSKHVKETQEAIDVIDQYRKQVNQRLIDLQGQIQDQAANQTTSP